MTAQIIEVEDHLNELIQKEQNLLVEFYSPTCGPCKMLGFVLEDAAEDLPDDYVIAQVNFIESTDLVEEFNVEGYPTVFVYKDGKEAKRFSGVRQKEVIVDYIQED